jgi:uncharacterized membrane protein
MTRHRSLLLALPTLLAVVACGGARDSAAAVGQAGNATGTTAQDCTAAGWTNITYANFAAAFFTSYCTTCHSSAVTGAARNGAPADHNFDTLAGARLFADHIDRMAGANPTLTVKNTFMPPLPPTPSDHERQQLACWIAAGTPP